MSHYTVLVIGADPEAQLAPFDENRTEEVDVTDECFAELKKEIRAAKDIDGGWQIKYAPSQGEPMTVLEFYLKQGKSEQEAAESWGGYTFRDGHYYTQRNVRGGKWDWYALGGRWTGYFKLKPHSKGTVGRPGILTEDAPAGYADQALKGDIDFEQMRTDAMVKARHAWKNARAITQGQTWDSWDDVIARLPNEVAMARAVYHSQPAIAALRSSGQKAYQFAIDDDLALDEEKYVERARDNAIATFAFLRDDIWTERGQMGWFATVADEMSAAQWATLFNQMLDALPDDTLLSLYDCHV